MICVCESGLHSAWCGFDGGCWDWRAKRDHSECTWLQVLLWK